MNEVKFIECTPISGPLMQYNPEGITLEEGKALELVQAGIVEIKDGAKKIPDPLQTNIDYLKRTRFCKTHLKPKIAWIQDMSKLGGAELSNCVVVNTGLDCGFDIVGVTPGNFNEEILKACDLIILNNCMEFSPDQFKVIQKYLFEETKAFVKYEHDYREFKRQLISSPIFTRSKLNVFISPQHMKRYIEVFGGRLSGKSVCFPLALDTSRYIPSSGVSRQDKRIFIPVYHKCRQNFKDYFNKNGKNKYLIIGQVTDSFPAAHFEYSGKVANERIPDLYTSCEYVYHCPDTGWAGERVVLEAILCGCKVIVNENVGHASWDFDYTNAKVLREHLDMAPYLFWKEIDQCKCTSR